MLGRSRVLVAALSLLPVIAACGDDGPSNANGGGGGTSSTSSQGGDDATTTTTSASGTGGQAQGGAGQGGGAQGGEGGGTPTTVAECYADDFVTPFTNGPDYDQFSPIVGSHCMGTNHQDIAGVERVVFLGDSVTVGTPPTLSADFYRSQLADALTTKFGLEAPGTLWKLANPFSGEASQQESGDFASCSKWGARTDDLLEDTPQILDCFPAESLDKRTLVFMTMGGNDLSALTQAAIDGAPMDQLWTMTQDFVQKMEDAVAWFYEPGRFPNGVFVVFGNIYEFTDGTGDVESCDVSGLAGFDEPVPAPDELAAMVIWANEQFVKIAVDHQADVIFLLEDFCGHGLNADDPTAPCYRGPDQEVWFDLTCIHPNPTGHDHMTDMFMAVVDE